MRRMIVNKNSLKIKKSKIYKMEEKIIENFEKFFYFQLLKDYKDEIRNKICKELDELRKKIMKLLEE